MIPTVVMVLCLAAAFVFFMAADMASIRDDFSKHEPVDVCRVSGSEHIWGEVQQSTIAGIVHQYQTCVTCNLRQERVDGVWM